MNKVMAFVMSLVFGVVLTAVVGFVVASIRGYEYDFVASLPFGAIFGLIIFLFALVAAPATKEKNA